MSGADRARPRTRLKRNRPVLHEAPLAAAAADCVVLAAVDRPGLPIRVEALAARALGDDLFEICCVPFFANDVAFGDRVHAPVGRIGGLTRPTLDHVTDPSGHVCLRIWFHDAAEPTERLAVESDIEQYGGRVERLSEHLLAVDVTEKAAVGLVEVLEEWENRDTLAFETGHTS